MNSDGLFADPGINETKTIKNRCSKTVVASKIAIGFVQANNEIDVQWYKALVFGYLKSYLETHLSSPVEFELVDEKSKIEKFRVIAISSTSQNYADAVSIARKVKEADKNIITILGGHHVTYFHDTMTRDFDIGVIGEGEQTFLNIVESIQLKGCLPNPDILRTIRGIVFWDNNKRFVTGQRSLIAPLDSLPQPFRVIEDKYYIFTSRGCPFSCSFCSSSAFWQRTRFFSAEYVVNEIEQLLAQYPNVTHIPIMDDLFIANKTRLQEIIELLDMRKITSKVSFSFSIRANLIDEAMCQTLTRLRIESVSFGAESGSDRILKLMNKNVTVAQNQNALNLLQRHKINVICSFIVGWPSENEKEVRKTFNFIAKNVTQGKLPSTNAINILMPIPGTSLWNESVRCGKIKENQIDWDQLSVFADYQHSKIGTFKEWVAYRKQKKSLYLAEDTLPQERLYEIMAEHYELMDKLQKDHDEARKKQSENCGQAKRIIELATKIEQILSNLKKTIEEWKVSKTKGHLPDGSALIESSKLFKASFAIVGEVYHSSNTFFKLHKDVMAMIDSSLEFEKVGKLIAASNDLDNVNTIIDEQLIPRCKRWPLLLASIIREAEQLIGAGKVLLDATKK